MATETATIPKPSSTPFSQFIDGFQLPGMFSADCIRSTLGYRPSPEDVILSTYPKCGTTWAQNILFLIFRQGQPFEPMQVHAFSPYVEMTGAEAVDSMIRPGVIKTHLPYHLTPMSDKAKYIYITRNPMDCCVSYFHHMSGIPLHCFNGTFDEFFELFISGKIDYGDYFDHLLGWYARRNDPNVLFMTYEEMKEDPATSVLKMASFIDDKLYAEPLRADPAILQNVIKYSSFDHMKKVFSESMPQFASTDEDKAEIPGMTRGFKELFMKMKEIAKSGGLNFAKSEFVRKGIIGDWKNYFSDEQYDRLMQKFRERTEGTDIPKLFEKYMVKANE